MPSIDTEQHFKFLLCCVKHSSGGKVGRAPSPILSVATLQPLVLTNDCAFALQVNFDNVAEEMQIVSKAAA